MRFGKATGLEKRNINTMLLLLLLILLLFFLTELSENAMTAQAILFILAGYNNTASVLSFAMHLLAMNQDVQEKLRKELRDHASR